MNVKRGRGKSRQGEPSDCDAGLTPKKGKGRTKDWKSVRHSLALKKSQPGRWGAPEPRLSIREVLCQAEWPSFGAPTLSPLGGKSWGTSGLGRNAAVGPKGTAARGCQ